MRDIDQGLKEKSDKWAKERKAMVDEKKELQAELDKVRMYTYSVDSVCIWCDPLREKVYIFCAKIRNWVTHIVWMAAYNGKTCAFVASVLYT